jgi:hypothetical protein
VNAYAGNGRVFVFLDDLDRCEIPKAADLMKAVNMLISDDPRLIFIIGMDRNKVAASLAVKYEGILPYLISDLVEPGDKRAQRNWGLEYGNAFIEKFIQIPFRLPSPDLKSYLRFIKSISTPVGQTKIQTAAKDLEAEREEFAQTPSHSAPRALSNKFSQESRTDQMDELQPSAAPDLGPERAAMRRERAMQFGRDSEKVQSLALMFAKVIGPNPRRVKQFINLFRLQAYIAYEIGLLEDNAESKAITLEQLGKFVAISLNWPTLLVDFELKPDLLKELNLSAVHAVEWDGICNSRTEWTKHEKLMSLLKYRTDGRTDIWGVANPCIYRLLHVCYRRIYGG